jgi:hypothetical protein
MGRKLLTLTAVTDTYRYLMNICYTLPESYQQSWYNNTLATVTHQIQQAENPTPAVVISVEAARDYNANLLDYLSSEVALEEPEIRSTDPNIPIDINCTDETLYFVIPGGSGDFEDEGDESVAIPTAGQRRRAATDLEKFAMASGDVDEHESEDGDDADADE